MDRPVLVPSWPSGPTRCTGAAFAACVTVLLGMACKIPSTLGLPCEEHPHCDPGQFCMDGTCVMGMPPMTAGPTSGPPMTTSGPDDGGSDVADDSTTSDGDSTTASISDSSSSTGEACGIVNCTDIDVLVVLDNSSSMMQWLLPLANSLNGITGVVGEALGEMCTFHVGITTGNENPVDNPIDCRFPGVLLYRPEVCGGGEGVLPYWTHEYGTVAEVLEEARCLILDQGLGGADDEMMLASLLGALNPENNEGMCNQGFRRPDAQLLVLYVTDEDDPTPTEELDTLAENFLMWEDPDNIVFISVVAQNNRDCPWDPSGTDSDGAGAMVPTALNGFLALAGIPFDQQLSVDICEQPGGMYSLDGTVELIQAACL